MIGSSLMDLRIPVLQAPMFLVSSLGLATACSRAGVIGSFQLYNARTADELALWLRTIAQTQSHCRERGLRFAPYAVNVTARRIGQPDEREKFRLIEAARVPLVISSGGDPSAVTERAHGWGGRVIHDVTTLRFAEKAMAAGVDGLMLTCAGAGGHPGQLSPFSFLPQVRQAFDGLIVLAGGIADGAGIRAALALGADLVCMGTRFIATRESNAPTAYKAMIVESGSADVVTTDAFDIPTANWLRASLAMNGLDPSMLTTAAGRAAAALPEGVRPWKTLWSGGHSVGLVTDIPSVAGLVDRLERQIEPFLPAGWRDRLAVRLGVSP